MDLTNIKTPDTETSGTPQLTKTLSFTNGSLSLKHPNPNPNPNPNPMMVVVSYKECLKNHAANIGGYSLDGCGEFMHAQNSNLSDPKSLKCAACGCHRNFHRRNPEDPVPTTRFLDFHHHIQSPSLSPKSPQPVQQAYYGGSGPHMVVALRSQENGLVHKKKRSRTKFSQEQKERMYGFAHKLGWKMQNSEVKLVEEFCMEVGVSRRVFKVWMHNHKNGVKSNVAAKEAAQHVDVNGKREDFEADYVGVNGQNGSSSSS